MGLMRFVVSYKMPKLKKVHTAIFLCSFKFKFQMTVIGSRARQKSKNAL